MRSIAPSPLLALVVRDLMVVETLQEVTRVRLPEPFFVMGIRYRGSATSIGEEHDVRLPDTSLTGIAGAARRMRTSRDGGILLARFHPGGAARVFDGPLHEISGTTISLHDVLPRADVERLHTQIGEARDEAARVRAMEAFLLARVQSTPPPDPFVARALVAIRERGPALKIGALARELHISQDALEKRFRRAVGTSPKQLASLLRLRRAIDAYRPGTPLTALALEAGYFDQSHFNRELRAITGEAPGHFFRGARYR